MLFAENGLKKHQMFEKWEYFEKQPSCKGYSPCRGNVKPLRSVQLRSKMKNAKNHSTRTLQLFRAENGLKKHEIFEKWGDFESQPSCKSYSPCKGHIKPLQSAPFGLKIKNAKNHSARPLGLFCAENGSKKHQIFEKRDEFENQPSWEGYRQCKGHIKALQSAQLGSKIKNAKNHSTRILELFSAESGLKKHQIFEKWDDFENWPSWKGYSPGIDHIKPLQNAQLGSKITNSKNMPKTILEEH